MQIEPEPFWRKMRKTLAIATIAILSLSGCGSSSTDSNINTSNLNGVRYTVVTNWTMVPADNDSVTDMYIRILKIETLCYIQTASVHDWQYSLVPHAATC